jgi:hypothetical protein
MTKSIALQAAAALLAIFATVGTFAAAEALATHQYAAAETMVMAQQDVQTVVIVGHRVANV